MSQINYRDDHDNKMLLVQDGHKPIATWEEKVATAMRAINQERHLTKDGVPLGPVNSRLLRKCPSSANRESGSASRVRGNGRGGSNSWRGGSVKRGSSSVRHGKENRPNGRAAAAPAAAPGAAAAAAEPQRAGAAEANPARGEDHKGDPPPPLPSPRGEAPSSHISTSALSSGLRRYGSGPALRPGFAGGRHGL